MTKPTVIDLFCGAGGLSYGFKEAGYEIVAGVELEETYLDTFERNHPDSEPISGDVAEKSAGEILQEAGTSGVDVVIGGPPCKGFSLAGERNPEDDRNNLVFEFADLVGEIRPQAFVMENVPGMMSMETKEGEDVVELVRKKLEDVNDYNVDYRVLNSCWYDVPQKRRRVIFIGYEDGTQPEFPKGNYFFESEKPPKELRAEPLEKCQTVEDALIDREFDDAANHEFTDHSDDMIKKMENQDPGESLYDTWNDGWIKLKKNEPSPTVKENHNAPFVHPEDPRVITVRECAELQSFSKTFVFEGPKSKQYKQVGNAVPPRMARRIGEKVKEKLD